LHRVYSPGFQRHFACIEFIQFVFAEFGPRQQIDARLTGFIKFSPGIANMLLKQPNTLRFFYQYFRVVNQ